MQIRRYKTCMKLEMCLVDVKSVLRTFEAGIFLFVEKFGMRKLV